MIFRSVGKRIILVVAAVLWGAICPLRVPAHARLAGQEKEEGLPPRLDEMESDTNRDGSPDGWYNFRDAVWIDDDGAKGPHFIRLHAEKPGRPARASRAFGLESKEYEAVIVGLWVRVKDITEGEKEGAEPRLTIDFLGDELRYAGTGRIGPWLRSTEGGWVHVAKRFAIPAGAHESILTISLWGSTGTLDFDGLSIEPIAIGGTATTNLVLNGDAELGSPNPADYWTTQGPVERVSPGHESNAAIDLVGRETASAWLGISIPVQRFSEIDVRVWSKTTSLRQGNSAQSFLLLIDSSGVVRSAPLFTWSGTSGWSRNQRTMSIPQGTVRAVVQFTKTSGGGSLTIDDLEVTASPNPEQGTWTPYHIQTDTSDWVPASVSESIAEGSALDASFLLHPPSGSKGNVVVKDGRFHFRNGERARFLGVSLVPPTAFMPAAKAEELAQRLADMGVNLVRLGDLDVPMGAGRSLFDDGRDDTHELDPIAISKLDHLIAQLKQRGVYVAIELLSSRKFREGDGLASYRRVPSGGGAAAAFDPLIKKRALEAAKALLGHVNPETGVALKNDPVLAFVTLAGEISVFNLKESPDELTPEAEKLLRQLGEKYASGPRSSKFWREIESAQWESMANELREWGLQIPIAGSSHWRREPEYCSAQLGGKLDFVDDRLYWSPQPLHWNDPNRRSVLWYARQGIGKAASSKRRIDRPYVLSQWCSQSLGAWALEYEAADFLLGVQTAKCEDWDAIVRRGVFLFPEVWGSTAVGTGGGEDVFAVPQVINGMPQIMALFPHAASLYLRGQAEPARPTIAGWDSPRGQLSINNAFTQGIAGWWAGDEMRFETLAISSPNRYGVVMATSIGHETLAKTNRILVTAVARVEPAGLLYVDEWRHDIANPGHAPFLQEPIAAKIVWTTKSAAKVKAYAVDNNGKRGAQTRLVRSPTGDAVELSIEGGKPFFHYELVAE